MRRTTLGTMNIRNKNRIPAKEKRDDKALVRPRSSIGVGNRLSNAAGPRLSGARPKTSFGSSRFVYILFYLVYNCVILVVPSWFKIGKTVFKTIDISYLYNIVYSYYKLNKSFSNCFVLRAMSND